MEFLRRRFKFNNGFYFDLFRLSGGLALWWTYEFKVEILWASKNLIHAKICGLAKEWEGFCSFTYGLPTSRERVSFWNEIKDFMPNASQ